MGPNTDRLEALQKSFERYEVTREHSVTALDHIATSYHELSAEDMSSGLEGDLADIFDNGKRRVQERFHTLYSDVSGTATAASTAITALQTASQAYDGLTPYETPDRIPFNPDGGLDGQAAEDAERRRLLDSLAEAREEEAAHALKVFENQMNAIEFPENDEGGGSDERGGNRTPPVGDPDGGGGGGGGGVPNGGGGGNLVTPDRPDWDPPEPPDDSGDGGGDGRPPVLVPNPHNDWPPDPDCDYPPPPPHKPPDDTDWRTLPDHRPPIVRDPGFDGGVGGSVGGGGGMPGGGMPGGIGGAGGVGGAGGAGMGALGAGAGAGLGGLAGRALGGGAGTGIGGAGGGTGGAGMAGAGLGGGAGAAGAAGGAGGGRGPGMMMGGGAGGAGGAKGKKGKKRGLGLFAPDVDDEDEQFSGEIGAAAEAGGRSQSAPAPITEDDETDW